MDLQVLRVSISSLRWKGRLKRRHDEHDTLEARIEAVVGAWIRRTLLQHVDVPAGSLYPFFSLKSSSYRHHFIEAVRVSVILTFA